MKIFGGLLKLSKNFHKILKSLHKQWGRKFKICSDLPCQSFVKTAMKSYAHLEDNHHEIIFWVGIVTASSSILFVPNDELFFIISIQLESLFSWTSCWFVELVKMAACKYVECYSSWRNLHAKKGAFILIEESCQSREGFHFSF